ncbi:MAG TPA: hypothetical protein VLA15_08490, partial [Desulfurivibrionaceae bacterium]|nr:hypothetical protein [Desulfurivibrionaceae bacterium]
MPDLKNSRGLQFLTDTHLEREELGKARRPEITRSEPFKTYPGHELIPLPTSWDDGAKDLWQCLQDRRSRRTFGPAGLGLATIAR